MNYLVVALGNPGDKLVKTRHNAGWLAVDAAFPDLQWSRNSYANAGVATLNFENDKVFFAKPVTFMNLSGEAVKYFIDKEQILSDHIIVIYDDIDLPLGKLRISFDRGSGGHNGIKSVEQYAGREFVRIRIGISKMLESGELVKPNVLGNFEESELETLKGLALRINLAIRMIIKEGKEAAMTEFNSQDPHIKIPKK